MESNYFSGDVIYRNYKIRYQSDGKELILFLNNEQSNDLVYVKVADGTYSLPVENKPLDSDYLCGTLDHSEGQSVVFFINPTNYSKGGLFNSYMHFRLKGYAIFDGNCNFVPVTNIVCQSMQMFRFLSYDQKLEHTKGNGTVTITRSFNVSSTSQTAQFSFEKENYSLSPDWLVRDDMTPGLKLKCENQISLSLLYRLSQNMTVLAQWLFFRTDFYFDAFKLQTKNNQNVGELFLNNERKEYKPEERGSIWRDSIPWGLIYPYAGSLFTKLLNNEIFTDHIPEKRILRIYSSFEMIQKDSSAFEATLSESRKKLVELTPVRKNASIKVREILDQKIKENEESDPEVAQMLRNFEEHIDAKNLRDKIYLQLGYYNDSLTRLRQKIAEGVSDEAIAKVCSKIRNYTDHGDPRRKVDSNIASCFGVLRALVVCQQLESLGMTHDEIGRAVDNLFLLRELGLH